MRNLLTALCALLFLSTMLAAQAPQTTSPSTTVTPATGPDIIVEATPDGPFPVAVDAKSYVDLGNVGIQASADAHFFSRCVKPFDNGSLHELIDGQPNREVRAAALNRIVRGYAACYPGYDQTIPRDYGTCNARQSADPRFQVCQAFFDRGALVEKALATYAPRLSFTTQQLFDPPVLARFHAREDQFDKTRSKGERIYQEVASCVVAIHPKLALNYLRSQPNSKSEGRMRNTLLGTSSECVGGAKQVTVDGAQFRVFMADAIYSWAVALKGTGSLIPYTSRNSLLR